MEARSFKTLLNKGKQGGASKTSGPDQDEEDLQGFYFLNTLVFSKDRPFQLQQFLRSMHLHLLQQKPGKQLQLMTGRMAMSPSGMPLQVIELDTTCWFTLHVLYTYSDAAKYGHLYDRLKEEFPWANFVLEQRGQVESQIMGIVENQTQQFMLPSKYELRPFFSFMVDDMIFFRNLNLHQCMLTLEASQTSFTLHLKLSPNICYSHTNNKLITLPKFEPAENTKSSNQAEVAHLVSQHSAGSRMSMMEADDGIGNGLFGSSSSASNTGNTGFEGGAQGAASSSMMRSSHGSSLGGYVERDLKSTESQSTEQQLQLTFLKFRRSESELDWNYPFDFCGSIYRLQSVRDVIAKITPSSKIAQPNTFEFEGNKAIKYNMLARNQPYSLCLNWPVLTVITVNKVQDMYKTPVYRLSQVEENKEETKGEVDPRAEEEACLQYMNELLAQNHYINLPYYREQIFQSVHVGDFVTAQGQPSQSSQPSQQASLPSVAVVMPVYNTNPQFLKEAIDSIVLTQTYRGPITLVIIDDGSTSSRTVQFIENARQMSPRKIRVFTLPENRGLPEALNTGMQIAIDLQVDYIARMDSDDISVTQRLETQINFLQRNPDIDIVGSNIQIFTEQSRTSAACKVIGYPTRDALIKHNMLFYCCIAHPSVVFRVASLSNKIVYNTEDPDTQAFEDYELWMRLIHSQSPPKFANIGTVLLLLRKHTANRSTGVSIESEIPMKLSILTNYYVQGELLEKLMECPQIVGEFIKVTGRPARSDTFSNLKQKREIANIFQQVSANYKLKLEQLRTDKNRNLIPGGIDMEKVTIQFILQCLENRQQELAVHAVTNDNDMDAMKGLIQSGALKRMLITPKKQH